MQDFLQFIQQHWALSAALVVVLVLLIIVEFIKLKCGAIRISPAQAIQLINRENAMVVDIRSPEAFVTGHIVDAISLPYPELEKKYKKLEKFKSQPIVITCATGLESPRAAELLMKYGFKTHVLNGGIRGWKDAEMPLVKN